MYASFIDISQGIVETHLWCGGIYNSHISLQIVCRVCQWKNFENQSIIGEDMDKSKVARFLAHPVYSIFLTYWPGYFTLLWWFWLDMLSLCHSGWKI